MSVSYLLRVHRVVGGPNISTQSFPLQGGPEGGIWGQLPCIRNARSGHSPAPAGPGVCQGTSGIHFEHSESDINHLLRCPYLTPLYPPVEDWGSTAYCRCTEGGSAGLQKCQKNSMRQSTRLAALVGTDPTLAYRFSLVDQIMGGTGSVKFFG